MTERMDANQINALNAQLQGAQLEISRLSTQMLKAQELMQALVAALNLNDAMMTELIRLGEETKRPIPIQLVLSKQSFDRRMEKLFSPPKQEIIK